MLSKLLLVLVALILVTIVGGVGYLAFANVPAPSTAVHKVLPDDRFPS
ncbi:MAG TPA: hypothetical protein VL574_16330 [Stellaceae bacterium]|jgi:hypothetical protein|nr:hypothetical protein [Stellaceae bacterium]